MIDWGSAPDYLTALAIAGGAIVFVLDRRKETIDRARQAELENLQVAWDALIAIHEVPGALDAREVKVAYVSAMRHLQLTGTPKIIDAIKAVGEGEPDPNNTAALLELIRGRYQELVHVERSASEFYPFNAQLPGMQPRVLGRATKYADQGLVVQANAAFVRAAHDDDPYSLSEYAKFLRRIGRLDQALEVNERIIGMPVWLQDDSLRAKIMRAEVIANMGVIRRQQNMLTDSESKLREAVATVSSLEDDGARRVEAYCRDNLALTLRKTGQAEEAVDQFEFSLRIRRDLVDPGGIARSLVHLAKSEGATGDVTNALALVDEAISTIRDEPDERLAMAHAYAAKSDLEDQGGNAAAAFEAATKALELNKELQNSVGEAIGHLQLSRLWEKLGEPSKAKNAAETALEINRQASNTAGVEAVLRRLASLQ